MPYANGEKLFRFNPFLIKEWTEETLKNEFTQMEEKIMRDDTPGAIAYDIEIYANMGYLMGEMIARYGEISSNHESQLKVDHANQIVLQRNQWMKTHDEKAPAMSYFEAQATSMLIDRYIELNRLESMLKRFRFAYESIQDKQNALKKKLDAIRFDTFNR